MAPGRPTKEAQDAYFRENNPDPWGYDRPFVKARLDQSLAFVQKFVPPNFSGAFVEVGAFNGDFSRRLARAFPESKIAASDLVKVAWEIASEKEVFPPSITFEWCDMFDYRLPAEFADKPAILVLMECIYYMPVGDRQKALSTLLERLPNARLIFVSGPIGGGDVYLTEEWLRKQFRKSGAGLLNSTQLNVGVRKISVFGKRCGAVLPGGP